MIHTHGLRKARYPIHVVAVYTVRPSPSNSPLPCLPPTQTLRRSYVEKTENSATTNGIAFDWSWPLFCATLWWIWMSSKHAKWNKKTIDLLDLGKIPLVHLLKLPALIMKQKKQCAYLLATVWNGYIFILIIDTFWPVWCCQCYRHDHNRSKRIAECCCWCTLKIYCFTILLRLHLNLIKATSCNVLLKEKRLLELNAAIFLVMKKMYFMKS